MKAERAHGAYRVLVRPHISEKSVAQNEMRKYVFEVYQGVKAPDVRRAIEQAYGVEVARINMITVPSKRVRFRRGTKGYKTRYRKAMVTLKSGHEIEVLPQ